ncbi:hypothetical protein [Vibrio porteresiae]|uniref:Uncharacterized protein n=1 Tax=Vibrio porteresiae DSM 19223 TaxID=1123496 RepID=A0ABZ0QHZ3_9VIBR|nr:hypothetical protein [Vibrio porteresiae]WPC76103.1 hypothetical protein R8Z52_24650 [Vibrio porteresiae DSM 19223]
MIKHIFVVIGIFIFFSAFYFIKAGFPDNANDLANYGSFSTVTGIPIAIYFGVIGIWQFRKSNKKETHPVNNYENHIPVSQEYNVCDKNTTANEFNEISINEIIRKIHDATPYEAKQIEKIYIGQKVVVSGYFKKIEEDFRDNDQVKIELYANENHDLHSIWFDTTLHEFPACKILEKGQKIKLKGYIDRVSGEGMCVVITPVSIEVKNA